MSRVRRLLVTNRIFFVTINLRRSLAALEDGEFPLIVAALEKSRKKLNFKLCSYVLMPDHWHALIGVQPPLTISRAVQDVKVATARLLCRGLLDFGRLAQSTSEDSRSRVARSILGPLRETRKGIGRKAGIHAPEPGEERTGRATGGLELVELEQLFPGTDAGGEMPDRDGRRLKSGPRRQRRKAHGTNRVPRLPSTGYPPAHTPQTKELAGAARR